MDAKRTLKAMTNIFYPSYKACRENLNIKTKFKRKF